MTSLATSASFADDNPIDMVEQLVAEQDWPFERMGVGDIHVCVTGAWCDYNVAVSHNDRLEALTLSAAFDFRASARRRDEVARLLALVNERVFIGHFDMSSEDGLIMFRAGLPLAGGAGVTEAQCEQLMHAALDACERFYPAFQFVLWGGKSPREAIEAAILDCQGEA